MILANTISHDPHRFAYIGAAGLLLVVLLTIYLISAPSLHNLAPHQHRGALRLPLKTFVSQWLDVHTGNSTDGVAVAHLCKHSDTAWHPDLVVQLDNGNGGIGNIRGNMLDFLYFAIASGSSLLLPSFFKRSDSDSDSTSLFDGRTPFSTFFDEDHFRTVLTAYCLDMIIFDESAQKEMYPVYARYKRPSMRTDLDEHFTRTASVDEFHRWLGNQGITFPLESGTTVARLEVTLWDGPDIFTLPPKLRRDFGDLLRHPPYIRRLAAVVTYRLAQRFGLDLDPKDSYYAGAGYMGAHLRTEADAAKAGWLTADPHVNFSGQTDAYLLQAKTSRLSVIYAASGSKEDTARFAAKAWRAARVNVTTKHELLSGEDLAELEALSWDQQALVDYEVLRRATVFGGIVRSSFSYNLAVSRAAMERVEGRIAVERWAEVDPVKLDFWDEVAFRDKMSVVWGRNEWHERKIPRGAWP